MGAKVPGAILRNGPTQRHRGARKATHCEVRVASLAWCEAEPVVPEVEWLPLISDALATTKHGKAVGPDALSAELLKTGEIWLLQYLTGLAARVKALRRHGVGGEVGWLRSPRIGMLSFALQGSVQLVGLWQRRQARVSMGQCRDVSRTRRPAPVLFTDLASAFYSAPPELAMGAVLSSRKRNQVFDALGIAGEQRVRLEELIRGKMLRRAGAGWQRTSTGYTWFWVSGSRKQVHAFVGTRLGDPFAEVVLAFTFLALEASLEHLLMQVGASVRVPRRFGGIFGTWEIVQEPLLCPTYVDLLAIPLDADSYPALLARLVTVSEGTVRILSDFGLQLSLAPGKTEAGELGCSDSMNTEILSQTVHSANRFSV